MEPKDTNFIVKVRSGAKEIEVQIPMSKRGVIGMKKDGTGAVALEIADELIKKLNDL